MTPESDYSQTPTLNVSPASTEARGPRRRVLGLATTLDSSNSVYRPRGDGHEARGATPSKKNSYDTVSGSITQWRQRRMCANLHNSRYNRRQFLAPATSFTDTAATCATYLERLQPRQCVFQQPQATQHPQRQRQCSAHLSGCPRPSERL